LVTARPPSIGYRFQKMARRHKLAFTATAAVAAALLIGLGLSTWQFIEKSRAYKRALTAEQAQNLLRQAAETAQANEAHLRQQAEADKKTAQIEAERSKQVARFLEQMLQGVGPSVALGRDTTILREILDKASDRVGIELTNQPLVEAELYGSIAHVYYDLHQSDNAERLQRKALAIQRQLLGNEDEAVARSLNFLGNTLVHQNNFTEAETTLRESLAIYKKLHGSESREVAVLLDCLAGVLDWTGRLSEAEAMYRDALEIERKLQNPRMADTLHNLAMALKRQHKTAEAETTMREALALHRNLLGNQHPFTANSLEVLGDVLCDQGKWSEAEPLYREVLAMRRKLFRSDDPTVSSALNDLVTVLVVERKYDEAELIFNEAQAPVVAGQPPNVGFLRLRVEAEARSCRFTEAVATVQRAIEIDPTDYGLWNWLAVLLVQTGQLDAYREVCHKSVERFGETTAPTTAERIAKYCLILPGSAANLDTVTRMANAAVAGGQQSKYLPYFQFCKGLAEYRQNHFDSAADWMDKVLTKRGIFFERDMEAYMVLSMSQCHLQHTEQARAALAAGAAMEQKLGKLDGGAIGAEWLDWIIAHALFKEAKALIEGDAKVGDHPK